MKRASETNQAKQVEGLEGCYVKVGHTTIRWVLEDGRYQWGARDIYQSGTYVASQPDEFSCIVELASDHGGGRRQQYRITRRGKTYTVKELPNGEELKFKREDGSVFLAEASATRPQKAPVGADRQESWKRVEDATAAVSFYLTCESVLHGATIPEPPSSKTPTIVRISHSNPNGRVDSDIFMRLGNPNKPLDVKDFDTVSDWQKAELVEDLLWSNKREEWVLAAKAKGDTSVWCGTHEVQFQFPKGHQQIELKVISRVPEVCSIVLSNWKVYVR